MGGIVEATASQYRQRQRPRKLGLDVISADSFVARWKNTNGGNNSWILRSDSVTSNHDSRYMCVCVRIHAVCENIVRNKGKRKCQIVSSSILTTCKNDDATVAGHCGPLVLKRNTRSSHRVPFTESQNLAIKSARDSGNKWGGGWTLRSEHRKRG